jgi:hypothetical protein
MITLGELIISSTLCAFTNLLPPGVDPNDPLFALGCLDVTKAPYRADPTGAIDASEALQRAVNDARDYQYVCFFPSGTYLISKMLSCEQKVSKLDSQKKWDGKAQTYGGNRDRPCILIGSKKGKRAVLKLKPNAVGFDDPSNPKPAVWVWAQTRDNAPGKDEPIWGKEQPNISFNQMFKGIDIDISHNKGAAGIRHTGSQGSMLEDVTIYADGAYAGLMNCPGQGGGTYNVRVNGGTYGIIADGEIRFPLLVGVHLKKQEKAALYLNDPASGFLPFCLAGFNIELTRGVPILIGACKYFIAGISLVDGIISCADGKILESEKPTSMTMHNVAVRGASTVNGNTALGDGWTQIKEYASCVADGTIVVNGSRSDVVMTTNAPPQTNWETIRKKHLGEAALPSFEDDDVVSVKTFGAKGDGISDDTAAMQKALAAGKKVFVPRGIYLISDTLVLGPDTALFGIARIYSDIRANKNWGAANTPIIDTTNDARSHAVFSDCSVTFPASSPYFCALRWRSGRNSIVHNIYVDLVDNSWSAITPIAHQTFRIEGNGGGKWYGVNSREGGMTRITGDPAYRKILIQNTQEPLAIYALNVERVLASPQCEIVGCTNVSIYYFKAESGPDPIRIRNSRTIAIYCGSGLVILKDGGSFIDVENTDDVLITQVKSFRSLEGTATVRVRNRQTMVIPSASSCTLFRIEQLRK